MSKLTQAVRTRQQFSMAYSANSLVSEKLGTGYIYRNLILKLTGQLTCTDTNNTTAKLKQGAEWGAIKEIRIKANGTDEVRRFFGKDLWAINRILFGTNPQLSPQLGNSSQANPTFSSVLQIPFGSKNSFSEADTYIDSSKLSEFRIEVVWGSHTDVNADATGFTVAPSLEVMSVESFFTQPVTKADFRGYLNQRVYPIVYDPAGANPEYQIRDIPVGPMYRGFIINTSVSGVDDPAVIGNIKALSGTNIFHDWDAEALQVVEEQRIGIAGTYASRQYDSPSNTDAFDYRAWYMLDFAEDGRMTEIINTVGLSEFLLRLEVLKAGRITIYPLQIIPIRD